VLPSLRETSAGVRARLFADQRDNPFFPRKGHGATASLYVADEGMGSDRNYQRAEVSVNGARSWGDHTLNATVSAGSDLGTDLPGYELFTLGGPLRLSGYRIGEFLGGRMGFGRLMYYNRTYALPEILGSGTYVGASLEAGRMASRAAGQPDKGTLTSASVFVGADTFLGPAYLGVGVGEAGRWSVYLLLGVP